MDARFSCNNPTMEILREAEAVFKKNFKISTLISIGSGRAAVSAIRTGPGPTADSFRTIIPIESQIGISCERTHEDVRQRMQHMGVYFRFDTGRDLDPALVKEWSQLPLIQTHTITYLQGSDVDERVDEVVKILLEPSEGTVFSTSKIPRNQLKCTHDYIRTNGGHEVSCRGKTQSSNRT